MAKARGFSSSQERLSCFAGSCPTDTGPCRSDTPSTGSNRESLGQNVAGGVDITIVNHTTFRTYPFTSVQRKRVYHMFAVMAGLRRWEETVNLDQGASVPCGFIFQLTDKLTPSHIGYSLCQLSVAPVCPFQDLYDVGGRDHFTLVVYSL
jgi:hypothetical protein